MSLTRGGSPPACPCVMEGVCEKAGMSTRISTIHLPTFGKQTPGALFTCSRVPDSMNN
jgi:hypothetical protein